MRVGHKVDIDDADKKKTTCEGYAGGPHNRLPRIPQTSRGC